MTDLRVILREARIRKGISQDQVAKALGHNHRSTVSRYESGEREPGASDLIKLARLLEIDLNELTKPTK